MPMKQTAVALLNVKLIIIIMKSGYLYTLKVTVADVINNQSISHNTICKPLPN